MKMFTCTCAQDEVTHQRLRVGSKNYALSLPEGSVQQGRSHFYARSVCVICEHGKMARTPPPSATCDQIFFSVLGNHTGKQPHPWAIPWSCLHEFLAIVTHPRIFKPPTPLPVACEQMDAWLESPRVLLLSETNDYWPMLRQLVLEGKIQGPLVLDARVAALCRHHGIQELWTADRDFSRFPGLSPHNPLLQ